MSTIIPHEVAQLQAAEDRGYLLDRSRRRVCLAARWWEICEREQRPYVRINDAGRQASVQVDLLPAAMQFSEAALKQIRELLAKYQGRWGICFLGKDRLSLSRLDTGTAEELVGALQSHVRPLHNVYPFEQRGVSR